MKKGIVVMMAFSAVAVWAQKPVYTKANLESARVYYDGAELTQNATIALPKGLSEVVITNVSDQLMENTIKVGSINEVTVMSVQFSNAYIEEYDNVNNSPLMKPLRDSIAAVEFQLEKITNSINADSNTISYMDNNSSYQSTQNDFKEKEKWIAYYGKKRQELQNGIYLKKKEKAIIEAKWNDLKSKLTVGGDRSERISQGKLIVQVMSAKEGSIPFKINYLTNKAQWTPAYDLRIDKVGSPIKMMYKAQVVQTSGIDWRNVKLSLTSGKINQSNQLRKWSPWFVQYKEPEPEIVINTGYQSVSNRKSAGAVSRISEKDLRVDGMPDVSRMVEGRASGVTVNSMYVNDVSEVSYEDRQTLAEYTSITQSQLNVTFDISIPYSILSNGKRHSVDLNTFALQGDYKYFTAPKLDYNAYLVTEISDYTKHNLLPGQANVIYDGMNVGQTYLSTENTEEKLRLSIGKDPGITVDRVQVSDKSGAKTTSSKKEQTFSFEITVKNGKNEAIALQVEDQFPLSIEDTLEIELNEVSNGAVNKERGLVTWLIDLKPNEVKKLRLTYTLRYDKDKKIEDAY